MHCTNAEKQLVLFLEEEYKTVSSAYMLCVRIPGLLATGSLHEEHDCSKAIIYFPCVESFCNAKSKVTIYFKNIINKVDFNYNYWNLNRLLT